LSLFYISKDLTGKYIQTKTGQPVLSITKSDWCVQHEIWISCVETLV